MLFIETIEAKDWSSDNPLIEKDEHKIFNPLKLGMNLDEFLQNLLFMLRAKEGDDQAQSSVDAVTDEDRGDSEMKYLWELLGPESLNTISLSESIWEGLEKAIEEFPAEDKWIDQVDFHDRVEVPRLIVR